ncbi:MAG TPA: ABC transporter permease [Bryobacteraceae bacterium]|nr:ABC transporter permease [Bryobacteraceae bacterium]
MRLRGKMARLLAIGRKRRLEEELESEIVAHLEMAEKDALASGLSPDEAHRVARMKFGGIQQIKEEHRERRAFHWLEAAASDFRHGLFLLRRAPGFTFVALGVLALGIGANTAMFSLLDAVLFKPLPFPQPERMVRVWETPSPTTTNGISTLEFLDWKRLATSFEALAAERPATVTLTGDGLPARFPGKFVSADYFRVFGVYAHLGRTFLPGEDELGAHNVVLLSHATWQTQFGADPAVLNRRIILNGVSHRIIGILPRGPFDRDQAAFWMPLAFTPEQRTRGYHWLVAYGRLRNGVTLEQAHREMLAIDARLTDLSPPWKRNWRVLVEPYDRRLVGDSLRQSLSLAFGAVVMVLLIACANVANLLLARGAARWKEMAVRAALGASRGRLIVQLLTESLALCLLGGALGVGIAHLLLRAATALLADSLPFTADVTLDLRVFTFAAAIALAVSLLVGFLPSLQTSFGKLARSMNQQSRGTSGAGERVRRAIVAAEVAFSFVLLCGALLLFRSLFNLHSIDTGVRMDNVITMSADLPLTAYPTPEQAALFYTEVTAKLKAAQGIEQGAVTTDMPLQEVDEGMVMLTMSYDKSVNVRYKRVTPEYFATLGIPVLHGRNLATDDRAGTPLVAVVNETLAAGMKDKLGLANPVDRIVRVSTPMYSRKDGELRETRVVGVIRSERTGAAGEPDAAVIYVPLAQVPAQEVKLIVRTAPNLPGMVTAIREAVRQADPNLALGDIKTLHQVQSRGLSTVSEPAWLIGCFAAVAAMLAALGLYGVLSHTVTQQQREIGIRLALGAAQRDVVSQVLRSSMSMAILGLALGLAGALALTKLLRAFLFQVSPLDPIALIASGASLMTIGLLAASIPALRAVRVDPASVLRQE